MMKALERRLAALEAKVLPQESKGWTLAAWRACYEETKDLPWQEALEYQRQAMIDAGEPEEKAQAWHARTTKTYEHIEHLQEAFGDVL